MKELVSVIIIWNIIKLSSYGAWNVKDKKNITGAIGVGILDIGMIFMLGTLLMEVL